jgi:uncharacterized protein involved in response to NO
MLNINEPQAYRVALHHLGFRPFFLLAGIFSFILVAAWVWLYRDPSVMLHGQQISAVSWHAHEMVYGYAMAVVAGFLLTAVRNWTGVQTLHGLPLMVLALFWLLARLMPFVPHPDALMVMAVFDLGFNLALAVAIYIPIARVKQWQQMGILSKVLILGLGNLLFYLGLAGIVDEGIRWGLYTGLYIIISLILLMARRVLPFFIEKGVDEKVELKNYRWVDLGSLVLMLAFWLVEVFSPWVQVAQWLALILAILHTIRLAGWYTPGIFKKPLLWVLYAAYTWIVLGFVIKALGLVTEVNPMLSVHAFAYGGVGIMTIGMMACVALGHTGRNVFEPPSGLGLMFLLLLAGSVVRVFFPWVVPESYTLWILVSQLFWVLAFALFSWKYVPMLIKPRVDGQYG